MRRTVLAWMAMLALAIAAFETVRRIGLGLEAPAAVTEAAPGPASATSTFPHVLLALLVVILAARATGYLFRYLRQPPVIGEVVAGIALGPSLLGRVSPSAAAAVLPASVAPFVSVIAQIGVVLFMFLVGLELDVGLLKKRSSATIVISHASILVPFLLGSTSALYFYPRLSSSDVPFTVFALFLGVSLAVTAFPVLARILTDRGMAKTRLGVLALTCAAIDDATAWCLLAFIVSVVEARASGALRTIGFGVGYVAVMLGVLRPMIARLVRRHALTKELPRSAIAAAFVALLASALVTETIGLHAIFGAFLLGAIVPHDSLLARKLTDKLEDVVVVLFLPAFFAFTGMRTEIGLLSTAFDWAACAAIVALASAGKFGGTFVAARLTGLPSREAASLGVLMNTRGLMELIVLNVGLDLHVISPRLFAMMVIMAVVTTFATTPILHLFQRDVAPEPELERSRP